MIRRLYIIIIVVFPLLFTALNLSAQDLVVSHVAGKVQVMVDGKASSVQRSSKLLMNSVVNIPYEGKLELLDATNKKRYCIIKPGKCSVKQHIATSGNSTMTITARYLAYMKSQIGDGANSKQVQRAHVYTDYATVTRDSLVFIEQVERLDIEQQINSLPPRERLMAKRAFNHQRHDAFRDSVIQRHLDFVRRAWTGRDVQAAIEKPIFQEVGPKIADPNISTTDRLKVADWFKGVLSKAKDYGRIILSSEHIDIPKTKPYLAVTEVEPLLPADTIRFPFEYFGTQMQVRLDERNRVNIGKIDPDRVADVLDRFSRAKNDNLVYDCLQLREAHNMGDWAYFEMIQTLSNEFFGEGTNEATLLTGYLAYRSGYGIRFACDADQSHLYLLMKSKHVIYGQPYFLGDDPDDKFYIFGNETPNTIMMCGAEFPQEQGISFYVVNTLLLDDAPSAEREIHGYLHPENVIHASTNQNLMKFYDTYPSSEVDGNVCTRWAMYACTPLDPAVCDNLYPQLKRLISGKDQVEQVNTLMDLIHGIPYKYDDEVWGHDRAFFAEETLHYEGCDCEDRAILLTRWVRDLMGLSCALVYYPGHLATAIHFDKEVAGDQFVVDGVSYTVCDPTYFGSIVGMQMPNIDADKARVMLLNQ